MSPILNKDQTAGLARIIVPVGVSFAVGRGWINAGGAGDVTTAILTIVASLWTLFAHTSSAQIAAVEAMPSVTKILVDPKAPADDAAAQAALDRDRPKVTAEPAPASTGMEMGTRSVTRDQRL